MTNKRYNISTIYLQRKVVQNVQGNFFKTY